MNFDFLLSPLGWWLPQKDTRLVLRRQAMRLRLQGQDPLRRSTEALPEVACARHLGKGHPTARK